MKTTTILFLSLLLSLVTFSQSDAKKEVKSDRKLFEKEGANFDWKSFDKASNISIDSIKTEIMQGVWKANNGFFKFGDVANSMSLTQPFIVEIIGNKIRRSADSEFEPFTLDKNQITTNNGQDKGCINKISESLLIISWQSGTNFTRYYYEKK